MNKEQTEILLTQLRNHIKQREINVLNWLEENKKLKDLKDKNKLNKMLIIQNETDEFTGKVKFSNAEKREVELDNRLQNDSQHQIWEHKFLENDKNIKETTIELEDNKLLFRQIEILSRLSE